MVIQVKNYIAGKFTDTSSKLDIYDFSGKELIASFPDSTFSEVRAIRRHASNSQEKIAKISYEKKKDILAKVAKLYLSDKEVVKAVIKIKGTPLKDINSGILKINDWLLNIDRFIEVVFGSLDNFLGGQKVLLSKNEIALKFYKPKGPSAIVLSRNMEAYEQFYVLAQGILSGNHLIVRASTGDVATYDFFMALDKAGGRDLAQLVYFNSEKGFDLIRGILESTKQSIIFASDSTINDITNGANLGNHIIHKYGTGLPLAIVTKKADISLAAEKIVLGAIESRGCLCISTTPVFVEKSVSKKLYEEINKIRSKLVLGNPTDEKVDIASYNNDEITKTKKTISESNVTKRMGQIYDNSMDLNLFYASEDSNIIQTEIPGCAVGLVEYSKLSDVISKSNDILVKRGVKKWILCSVFGDRDEFLFVKRNLLSYIVRHNVATNDLNLYLPHQGSYFILDLLDTTY